MEDFHNLVNKLPSGKKRILSFDAYKKSYRLLENIRSLSGGGVCDTHIDNLNDSLSEGEFFPYVGFDPIFSYLCEEDTLTLVTAPIDRENFWAFWGFVQVLCTHYHSGILPEDMVPPDQFLPQEDGSTGYGNEEDFDLYITKLVNHVLGLPDYKVTITLSNKGLR